MSYAIVVDHVRTPTATPRYTPARMPPLAGIGFRPELAISLLEDREGIDLLELLFESSVASTARHREALAMARVLPCVVHGTKLSLGSAGGIDRDRARRLGRFAREVGAIGVSEHASFVRAAGREIGHLTALPFSREALDVVTRNIDQARRDLPDVPFWIENVAWGFRPPGDEMDEGTFHAELAHRARVPLLLDVANVLANARNSREDPRDLLARYPLDSVGLIHVAGGRDDGGFWVDSHADAVGADVFALLEQALAASGPVPVIVERDEDFPAWPELAGEVRTARGIAESAPPSAPRPSPVRVPLEVDRSELEALQARIAGVLVDGEPDAALGIPEAEANRARSVLRKKRLEAAVSLLPGSASASPDLAARAAGLLSERVAGEWSAAVDALEIARALAADPAPRVRAAAALDRAVLEARFSESSEGIAPRYAPALRRAEGAWVVKGIGRGARVRVIAR